MLQVRARYWGDGVGVCKDTATWSFRFRKIMTNKMITDPNPLFGEAWSQERDKDKKWPEPSI